MVERRLAWPAAIVLIWGGLIFYKLISLQVTHHQEYVRKARNRQEQIVEVPAQRGAILDRTGHPLALSVTVESVEVDPLTIPSLEVDSDLLANELHLNRDDVYNRMQAAYDNHRGTLVVKHGITTQESEDIRALKRDWIHVTSTSERHYPNITLAAHVLGGVDFEEKGNGGIEKALENELHGAAGEERVLTDVQRRGIDEIVASQARAGATLTLTIHERLQFIAERELAAEVEKSGAVSGSVVVMLPHDGQILALASYPQFDPNQPPSNPTDLAARSNHAVAVPFEPGSCFKVITLAAALETTKLRPNTLINCHGGVLTLPGHRIVHDSHLGNGYLPMDMVLAHSSNIGAIEIGRTVGRENMFDYVHRFGFDQKSGIQLPGESKGLLRPLKKWGSSSLESISMGQEIGVTTLQLARAVSVVANGGLLVKPRMVLKVGDQTIPVEAPVRAIKPETAITMQQMMEGVVLVGTGKRAKLDGYTSAGKTGSAQIYDYESKRYTHNYNGSFMGFAPVTNPAVVVVVTLNGTHGNGGFGGETAGPVFHNVMTEALRILDVPKDMPESAPSKTLIADAAESMNDLSAPDLGEPNILEDRDEEDAVAQVGPPFVGPIAPRPAKPEPPAAGRVPNFKGMTLKAAIQEAEAKGIVIQPAGSGVARIQNPPAGAVLHQGERIRVQFDR